MKLEKTYLDRTSGFIPVSRKNKEPVDKIQETQNKLIQAMKIILTAIEK